ncbi:unnamed protein product [Mesocestoides corti]|uniref:C2H2-type domain-containing protein n=1 Tax=Mesocestoides corti TaxID=53468 RepID=A0A0R3UDV1_MESCO|nr:unnamed protein product [Mesocestoides corti]
MSDSKSFQSYPASIFSDESDLASDIEADLQELPAETDSQSCAAFSSDVASLGSFASPFTGSLSSVNEIPRGQRFVDEQPIYLPALFYFRASNSLLLPSSETDRCQEVRLCLDTTKTEVGSGQGPITSLSQNLPSSRLLSGFASGRIAMWQMPETDRGEPLCGDAEDDDTSTVSSSTIKKGVKKAAGSLLRIINDAHQDMQSIIVCAFTSLPTVAVSVDSGGSVFEMDFRRGLLGRSTQSVCFFSGSHGEICAMSPLRPAHSTGLLQSIQGHSSFRALFGSAMVAMASFTKVIVVMLKPKFRVVFWQYLKGQPSCLPLLSWSWHQPAGSPDDASAECCAFLGFARSSSLHIARITTRAVDHSRAVISPKSSIFSLNGKQFVFLFDVLRTISLDHRFVSLHVFSLDYIAVLDSEEILRLIDLSTEQEVESFNMTSTQICYNSSAFKALAIGGAVSEALACASERACANSVASASGKLLILGKNGISLIALKSWKERATSLFNAGRLEEALACCRQVVKDSTMTPQLRQSLLEVLNEMPLADAKLRPTPASVSNLVEICVVANLVDFLQSSVIPAYRQDKLTFPLILRCLCTRLLQLKPIYEVPDDDFCLRQLAPDIVMEILVWSVHGPSTSLPSPSTTSSLVSPSPTDVSRVQQPRCKNGRQLAESCLVRFSPASLDIDKVVKFCLSNGLYQGFAYVYSYVLQDHEAAFRRLTDLLLKSASVSRPSHGAQSPSPVHSAASSDSLEKPDPREAVNAILLFLKSCFVGEEVYGLPLAEHFHEDVPSKLFNLLLSSQVLSPEHQRKPLFSQPTSSARSVPRLRVLLHFGGTVDLLNMLTLALQESPFFSFKLSSTGLCCQRRQRLLNALALCALDETSEAPLSIDADDVARLLCFIGKQLLLPENDSLVFDNQKILSILDRLVKLISAGDHTQLPTTELSDVLFRLLSAGRLAASAEMLKVAENIGLNDFCELVYRRQGNLGAVLSCLLSSIQRTASAQPVRNTAHLCDLVTRVYVFLSGCLNSPTETGANFAPLVNRFLEFVEMYATLDPLRCLILLMHGIGPSMRRILCALDTFFMSDEPLPPNLLAQNSHHSYNDDTCLSPDGPHHPAAIIILEPFYELLHSDMPDLELENAISTVEGDTKLRLALDELLSKPDPLVAEFYIRLLLAAGRRETLINFLKINAEYRASVVLELLDEESYPLELACICEKTGDKNKAFEFLQKDFLTHWDGLVDCCSVTPTSRNPEPLREHSLRVHERADAWFAFAARQCSGSHTAANEASNTHIYFPSPLWYAIIDVLSTLRKQQMCDQLNSELNLIFQKLLESASPFVPIPSLINRVLQLVDTSVASFGSATNRFLLQLVGVWHKEVKLMRDCHRLMSSDVSASEQRIVGVLKRGVGLRRYSCSLCGFTFARRYRLLRSLVTCSLHTGGFSTLDEKHANKPEIIIFWYDSLTFLNTTCPRTDLVAELC